jgi:hypothetical protein
VESINIFTPSYFLSMCYHHLFVYSWIFQVHTSQIEECHWFKCLTCNTSLCTSIHITSHYMFSLIWSSSDAKVIVWMETVVLPLSCLQSHIACGPICMMVYTSDGSFFFFLCCIWYYDC